MLLSMAVIVGIVLLLVALVPRPNGVVQPTVDVGLAAQGARDRLSFVPSVPAGLPSGWVPRAASVQRGTDGVQTWHLAYVTPSGRFAGIQQAADPTRAWENAQVTDGREDGTHSVAGHDWVIRSRTDRGITSWVLRRGRITTVVTGTATTAELDTLAASLPLPAG